jgi:hypothetical protein
VTKEKKKSVQFKRTARTNENTARLRGFEMGRDHVVHIGTIPHLPPALTADLIISYLTLVRQNRKTNQFSSPCTATMNTDTAQLLGFKTDAAPIGIIPYLPPALTADLIISYLKLVR